MHYLTQSAYTIHFLRRGSLLTNSKLIPQFPTYINIQELIPPSIRAVREEKVTITIKIGNKILCYLKTKFTPVN